MTPRATVAASVTKMPDLIRPTRGLRHRVESAVSSLRALGLGEDAILIEAVGGGWARGTVVEQDPAPGTPILPGQRVRLGVSGPGALHALPFAMRTEDDEALGADRLMALFDHEWFRALVHLRAAGGLFDLSSADAVAARRFCEELFAFPVRAFAPDRWYRLARALPYLSRLGGLDSAITVLVPFVTGVPVQSVRSWMPATPPVGVDGTRLGQHNLRLGVDAWIGPTPSDSQVNYEVTLGPVVLEEYLHQIGADRTRERHALYRALLPSWVVELPLERWLVGSASDGTRLGSAEQPVRLGINSHLGDARREREEDE